MLGISAHLRVRAARHVHTTRNSVIILRIKNNMYLMQPIAQATQEINAITQKFHLVHGGPYTMPAKAEQKEAINIAFYLFICSTARVLFVGFNEFPDQK